MKGKTNGKITLILAGILLTTVAVATGYHCNQADKVVITEHILHGDKSQVADIAITQYDTLANKLIWEITTPLADVSQATTSFTQFRSSQYAPSVFSGSFNLYYSLDYSASTSGTFDFETEDWSYPTAMLQDVASRVPVGEEYTETVTVADYGDSYTPSLRISFPQIEGSYRSLAWDEEVKIIQYFTLPVEEGDQATVTMTHNGMGGISKFSISMIDGGSRGYGDFPALFVGDDIYVASSDTTGVQLHRIDCLPAGEDSDNLIVDSIQQVADFPGESLFWGDSLVLCQEGDQLLLFCGEYDLEKILVLSLPNLTLQQEIGIENLDFYTTYQQEDFLALLSYNGDFIILEERSGHYTQALQGNYATHTDYSSGLLNWVTALDYQDGKLVTAFRNHHYTADHSSVYVSVNTAEGCIFTGLYTTSLQEETPITSSIGNRVEQWSDMPLAITSEI